MMLRSRLGTEGSIQLNPIQLKVFSYHDEVHAALVAESTDKLRVLRVVAVLGKAAEAGGSAVERLSAPAEERNNFNISINSSHQFIG